MVVAGCEELFDAIIVDATVEDCCNKLVNMDVVVAGDFASNIAVPKKDVPFSVAEGTVDVANTAAVGNCFCSLVVVAIIS